MGSSKTEGRVAIASRSCFGVRRQKLVANRSSWNCEARGVSFSETSPGSLSLAYSTTWSCVVVAAFSTEWGRADMTGFPGHLQSEMLSIYIKTIYSAAVNFHPLELRMPQ